MLLQKTYIVLILFVVIPTFLFAQWSATPNNHLKIAADGINVSACSDGNGGAYVVYSNFDYNRTRVFLQHVNKFGYVSLDSPLVLSNYGDSQGAVQILEDGYGGAIIYLSVAITIGQVGGVKFNSTRMFLQRIDKNCNKLWGENGVLVSLDTSIQKNIGGRIITDKYDNVYAFYVVIKEVTSEGIHDLKIQRIRYDGQRMWGDSGIVVDTTIPQQVTTNFIRAGNRIIVSYTDSDGLSNNSIVGYDTSGQIQWKKNISEWYYSFQPTPKGDFFLSRFDPYGNSIYKKFQVNMCDTGGNFLWNNWLTIKDSVEYLRKYKADVVFDSILVINYTTSTFESFCQLVTRNNIKLFPNSGITFTKKPTSKYYVSNILQGYNQTIIALCSDVDANNKQFSFLQRVSLQGNYLWSDSGKILSTLLVEGYPIIFKSFISDNENGAIAVGNIDPVFGVYAQQVNKDGNLGIVLSAKENINATSFVLKNFDVSKPFPNPFNSSTTFKLFSKFNQEVRVLVFDLLGRNIFEKGISVFVGENSFVWGGVSNDSKVIATGVYYVIFLDSHKNLLTHKALFLK